MPSNAYRLKDPLMAVVQDDISRLIELPAGTMFYCSNPNPDTHGMIKGTCKGHMVLLFLCDLEERAEALARVM